MIPVKHIDPDDLALYAMQLLSPEEMEEMGLHLQHSAEARRVLSEIYGDLSILAHTADMHSPPALTRQRLMKHVAREKKAIPIDIASQAGMYAPRAAAVVDDEPVQKSAVAKVLPWLGWTVAAGLCLPVVNLYRQRENLKNTLAVSSSALRQTELSAEQANAVMDTVRDPAAVHVVLTAGDVKPPAQGRASYNADKGALVFLASNLDPLKAYQTYELWLIPADGRDPIPAGTFRPDSRGNASVVMPALPKGVTAKAFGVTVEDGEGSQSPTMPILLKGAAS